MTGYASQLLPCAIGPAGARDRWLLQINAQSTLVLPEPGDKDAPSLTMPVGTEQLAAGWRRGNPPTLLQIEQAIEAIEDAVMPARARFPAALQLATRDPHVHALSALATRPGTAEAASTAAGDWLGIAAVEQLFNRLAARAGGRPASQDALPVDGASAARLLILRELLHHWGLPGVALVG
ncbi:hypothetical protein HND92_00845 [Diaphorobacter sp. JS3050]|uniref:hypothetical protein n=1 Tax=Diaphorobacter sp. JS3050 TaxID=2735554 RepID=UPI001551B00B|nr:hypothetical protein [Diaphorobacter sp. JS3050]QJY31663.1 hypothetical protein HND92_00845 [Diaphorobacter sp. JS3050]